MKDDGVGLGNRVGAEGPVRHHKTWKRQNEDPRKTDIETEGREVGDDTGLRVEVEVLRRNG